MARINYGTVVRIVMRKYVKAEIFKVSSFYGAFTGLP